MAIARPVRLWRAQPLADQGLPLPPQLGQRNWMQLIDGGGSLQPDAAAGSPVLTLQQGDGLGFEAGRGGRFVAGSGGADLLLFALD